ncbi:MAG: DUF3108 domain-containing protein [Xanthomonadales bacterium]|jgi:hypothetical protein|nr:DUF3108 domain-containing protein [Xanthomonadales bacterium]
MALARTLPTLEPFQASFDVLDDGKRVGRATLSLKREGEVWIFTTDTTGERGMAGFLGAKIHEQSRFRYERGQLQSLDYRYRQKISFRERTRRIDFDWASRRAREDDGKRRSEYALPDAAIDRHLAVLALMLDLSAGRSSFTHPVAYKGEVEAWRFRNGGRERLTTPDGPLDAIKLERIRENAARRTVSWHAESMGWLPVRIEQIEPDGERYTLTLVRMQRGSR